MLSAAHDILKEEEGGGSSNGTANTTVTYLLPAISVLYCQCVYHILTILTGAPPPPAPPPHSPLPLYMNL